MAHGIKSHVHANTLASFIDAIGTEGFGERLTEYVRQTCAVDYCSAFQIGTRSLAAVSFSSPRDAAAIEHVWLYVYGQMWRRDTSLLQATARTRQTGQAAVRLRPADVTDRELRAHVYTDLVDRLLLCSTQGDATFGISLLRWDTSEPFENEELLDLEASASVVMAAIGRHAQALSLQRSPADALASLGEAEQCLAETTQLPAREREVCAQTLFGNSAPEIAVALRISPETVKCYRKRAYNRLGVSGERDLLITYLQKWNEWRADVVHRTMPRSAAQMPCLPADARTAALN